MMNVPENLRYSKDHEWVRLDGDKATVGITDFAQHELGDVVFIEVPEFGKAIDAHAGLSVVESVKAVSDVYAPIAGTVVEVNDALTDSPELVNQDPYGQGWIAVLELADLSEYEQLMDAKAYQQLLEEEA